MGPELELNVRHHGSENELMGMEGNIISHSRTSLFTSLYVLNISISFQFITFITCVWQNASELLSMISSK